MEPWMILAGTSHGQAYVIDLRELSSSSSSSSNPPSWQMCSRHGAEVTAVAWNSQVPYICATACATDGSVIVWDLKTAKPWCELRTQSTADVAWNPQQGLHLLTADGPVVNVWDLAASTTLPVAQLSMAAAVQQHPQQQQPQHAPSILQMDWCPHDETLLVTTAKDGKVLVWDLQSMQPLAELPNDAVSTSIASSVSSHKNNPASLFAASSTPLHVRYEIHWSPHHRGVLLTCRLDKTVQIQSLPALPRPPAWMQPRACRAAQGFGATLATVGGEQRTVTLSVVPSNPELIQAATATTAPPRDVCLHQQAQPDMAPQDVAMWGFLSVLFESDSRKALVEYLGYQADEISQDVQAFVDQTSHQADGADTTIEHETITTPGNRAAADALVQKALLVGDFQAAVDACLAVHNFADALLLASIGGPELWATTQQTYLQHASAGPHAEMVQAILQGDLQSVVESSDLQDWQQTLALLSTYSNSQEFPALCQGLAKRIQEAGDEATASLCFICAMDFEAVLQYWKQQLGCNDENGAIDAEQLDWKSLHDFCTKVAIMQQACPNAVLTDDVTTLFSKYAELLAQDGLLAPAAAFAKDDVLKDRLYRSRSSASCLAAMQNQPPAFPYTMQAVDVCRGVLSLAEQRYQAAEQARLAAERQAAQQRQQEEYQRQREAQEAARELQRAQQQQQHASAYGNQGYGQVQHSNGYAQHGYQQQQHHQPAASMPQAPAPSDELPPGWIALQDPNSGMTYYANQTTGETTWDRPAPVSAPAPAPQPAQAEPTTQTPSKSKKTVASKYGDGFVSSASDPKLAYQYGNVGTSNPYHGAERPGTAAAAVGKTQEAPISETFNVDALELGADLVPLRDSLVQLVDSLKSMHLGAADKRQLTDGEKAVAIFVKKLARQAIHDESLESSKTMVSSLVSSDFRTATAMQTALVNSDWREHKDWLKGFKSLIQLASRKLAHPHPIQY